MRGMQVGMWQQGEDDVSKIYGRYSRMDKAGGRQWRREEEEGGETEHRPAVVTGMEILLQQVHQLLQLTQHLINIRPIFALWVSPLQGRSAAACSGKLGAATAARTAQSGGQSVDDDLASSGGQGGDRALKEGPGHRGVGTACLKAHVAVGGSER